MNTVFTIENEPLGSLDSISSVKFFRELIWAEARSLGIPINEVQISLSVNIADGGIDVVVNDCGIDVSNSGLVKKGKTYYQIKTGTKFLPWQANQIEKELFGKKEHKKENLGSKVRECLENDGTYIFVCFGIDLTPDEKTKAENLIISYLKNKCGYDNPKVEVWGQGVIAGFTQKFPSLVLHFKEFDNSCFQTHDSWSSNSDMKKNFESGPEHEKTINDIREELRKNDKAIHIRVLGEAGIGKTRLILETLNTEDLKPLVIYCDSPNKLINSSLLNEILNIDNHFSIIIVVDECNSENRSRLWNLLENKGPRIKLISIYNEFEDNIGTTSYYSAPLLSDNQTSKIIQSYNIDKNQSDRWAEICSGSPRVAHVIGINLINNPADVLKQIDTVDVWDRYLVGKGSQNDPETKQELLILMYLALFKKFGFLGPVIGESQAIEKIIESADKSMTWPLFQKIISQLRKRKILQGETTLYITPKALHIYLWKEWWNTYGNGFDFDLFSKDFIGSMKEWFYEMFKYAAESKAASDVVERLLGEDGPFQKDGYLQSKLGPSFFLTLTEANPKAALSCLKNTIDTWNKSQLLELKGDSRRYIVWSLEKISVIKELFNDAALILLKLAEAENEGYANNASGVFTDLFSLGVGKLASTQAPPKDRFPILEEAIKSSSKEIRSLAINALNKSLEANYFSREIGPERHGLKEIELWQPKGREEVVNAYIKAWKILYSNLNNSSKEDKNRIEEILLSRIRGLIQIPELVEITISDLEKIINQFSDKEKILKSLESILHYDKKRLPEPTYKRVEKFKDKIVGNSFHDLLIRYAGMDLLEDQYDEDGNRFDKTVEPIKKLIDQIVENNELITNELSWLMKNGAKNGFKFAYKLGLRDKNFTLLPKLLENQKKIINNQDVSDYFLSGYLKAIFEKDPEYWEKVMDEIAEDKSGLARLIPGFTWRSGMSDRAAKRILNLAKQKIISAKDFSIFGYGSVISDLSENIFIEWLEFLLSSDEPSAASIALDLLQFYFLRKEAPGKLPEELTLKILTHPSFLKINNNYNWNAMNDWNWKEVGIEFIENYPKKSLLIADMYLEHFGEEGTIFNGFNPETEDVINKIANIYPKEIWNKIIKYLGPPIDSRAYHIKEWLRSRGLFEEGEGSLSSIPMKSVWNWVNENVEKRAWYLATFVPNVLHRQKNRICWARELLIKYGDRKDVRNNLAANFMSEGWTGPASLHYQGKLNSLIEFKKEETNKNVILWLDEFIDGLTKQIEREKIDEERRGF